MIYFSIQNNAELVRVDKKNVSAGTTNLKAKFELQEEFEGDVIAYFNVYGSDTAPYTALLHDGECVIPWEVLRVIDDPKMPSGIDHIMVVSVADTMRKTSSACKVNVLTSAFDDDTEEGQEPSQTPAEEVLNTIPNEGNVDGNDILMKRNGKELFRIDARSLGGGGSAPTDQLYTTAVDFTNWANGTWEETLSDGSKVTHTVTFNDSGIPATIDGATITFPAEVS